MSRDKQFSSPVQQQQKGLYNSDSHVLLTNKCEHVFITLISAADVACGLRRMPAGFHVIVEVDERIIQTPNKPVSTERDAVEWDVEILLPSNQSSFISISIYASFELGPRMGNGELLGHFKITVGEMLHHQNEQLQRTDFTAQNGDILPSCSSIRIITEQRVCDAHESCPKLQLPDSCEISTLDQFTDEGHHALLRYRQLQDQMDLDIAIQTFQRVQDICPIDHPNLSTVLFNLANAKFIDSQASNRYLDLDVPIGLYRDALRLRSKSHPDHCTTVLGLVFALLARFQRQGFEFDREEAQDLLAGVLEASRAESYAHRAALFGLQMVEASLLAEARDAGSSLARKTNTDDAIQEMRNMLRNLSSGDPRRPALLTCLGARLLVSFERSGVLADVHEAISMFDCAMDLMPHNHPDKLALFVSLGEALLRRCKQFDNLADLNRSISMFEKAICLMPEGHPDQPAVLQNLGILLQSRFSRHGDLADLNRSISIQEEAVCLSTDGHPDKPSLLSNLGDSLYSQFEHQGELTYLNRSISIREEAVCLMPDGHLHKPRLLENLGKSLKNRFQRHGDLADLNRCISVFEDAICLTPDGHLDKPGRLSNLGILLHGRFAHHGDLADLNRSISMSEKAVSLTPDGHPDKPGWLNILGLSLGNRFEHFEDHADLNRSISVLEEAIDLTHDGHPDKPSRLRNLGISLHYRFARCGDLADLNRSISVSEEAISLMPDDHLDEPTWLCILGVSLRNRFEHYNDLTDLHRSISIFERAVSMIPEGPKKPAVLHNFGISLHRRFERHGDLTDLTRAIARLEEAIHLTPDNHPDKPNWLNHLGHLLQVRFDHRGDISDLTRSISILEAAVSLTPDSHPGKPVLLNNLGNSMYCRFVRHGNLADLNRSISIREEAVCLIPEGHSDKSRLLNNIGNSLESRFEHHGDLADVNRSISMQEEAVCLTPDGHPDKLGRLNSLGCSLYSRFERCRDLADLTRSISIFEQIVFLRPEGSVDKPGLLNNLGNALQVRFNHHGDLADITRTISIREEAVCLTPDDHPNKPSWLSNLAVSLIRRFEAQHPRNLVDVVKSISMIEKAISLTPDDHPGKPTLLIYLGNAFRIRFEHTHDSSDLSAAALNFSIASRTSIGRASTRFNAACAWISCARLQDTTALLDACASALNILPQLAWLGLPVTERHRLLVEAADVIGDSVAAALEAGHPELAVEWLEQGRSIVWTQFLQLRTPVDDLSREHPALASRFREISHELERASTRDSVTFSQSASISVPDTRLLEKDIQRHHDLALRLEDLLLQIRSLPGFDRFLLPKTIEQLGALASAGPVVYLTASKKRCDALIVMAELDNVIHVPLPQICYGNIETLRRMLRAMLERRSLVFSRDALYKLVPSEDITLSQQFLDLLLDEDFTNADERGAKLTKSQPFERYTPNELYQRVLKFLWNEVVNPVLQALGFSSPPSGTDKTTRVFWCPTGPFSFLPIHAAGLYDTTETGTRLSDFVISSYLPTLSSLASSPQNSLDVPPRRLRLLAVPQPSTDGFGSTLFSVKDEISSIRELSDKSPFVTLQDSDGTVEDVMEKLKDTNWVHFACHGIQDPMKPLDSGLGLADNRRLKLSDITQLSRPQGGLAFLSACQTAQGDETLSDECVHLAAGMLLAGYGGVIGTMWSIMDKDAPKVARDVYEYLFRDTDRVPDSTEAAAALHRAIQHLRDSGASFTSWVPFIHFGR